MAWGFCTLQMHFVAFTIVAIIFDTVIVCVIVIVIVITVAVAVVVTVVSLYLIYRVVKMKHFYFA